MAELRSIQDAARGMPLTVDSRMANEMHQLNSRISKLQHDLKRERQRKNDWRFWAYVGLVYGSLMLGAAMHYKLM